MVLIPVAIAARPTRVFGAFAATVVAIMAAAGVVALLELAIVELAVVEDVVAVVVVVIAVDDCVVVC